MNILIAEDDHASRELLRETLEIWGHVVIECMNGEEAVQKFQDVEVQLVLLDVQMPVLDGVGAVKQLRALGRNDLCVVAITAFAMAGDRERFLKAGFNHHLSKPMVFAELKNIVDSAAREWKPPQKAEEYWT